MCASAVQSTNSILLYDIPWKAYEGLVDALAEQRFRHTYQNGVLELFKNVLYNVSWKSYEQILAAFGDRRFRHTYQNGTLEMISPSNEHEWIKRFLGRMIEMAAWELKMSIRSVGSATRRSKELLQGVESDESYYIGHDPIPRSGRSAKNLPPPELVVEIDLRRPDVNRLESYAALGVREVWRFRKNKVEIHVLEKGNTDYRLTKKSRAFPLLTADALTRFVKQAMVKEERIALENFVAWLRKQVAQN